MAIVLYLFLAPEDYTHISDVLLFIGDELISRKLCRNISIIPDAVVENVETFQVFITSEESGVVISRPNATVTIQDSSGKLSVEVFDPVK